MTDVDPVRDTLPLDRRQTMTDAEAVAMVVESLGDSTPIGVLATVLRIVTEEAEEPWDEENLWTARRVRAVILDEPEPPHPSLAREATR